MLYIKISHYIMFEIKIEVSMKKYIIQLNLLGLLLVLSACTHQIRPIENITSVADDPNGIEKWVLQNSYSLQSSTHSILALVSENQKVPWNPMQNKAVQSAPLAYDSSYNRSWTKNILFINKNKNKASWLFKKNNQLIIESYSFPQQNYRPFMKPIISEPKVIFYKIINRDTNSDKKINLEDNHDLAISDTEGKRYRTLVKNIGHIISMELINNSSMIIVYQQEEIGYSLKLSLDTLEVLSNVVLPKVGV